MQPPPRRIDLQASAWALLRKASVGIARVRPLLGTARRSTRRIAQRARLAFAAGLIAAPLAQPAVARAPQFLSPVVSPFGLTDVGGGVSFLDFADIDADGDLDAFVGGFYGDIYFLPNTGAANSPAFGARQTDPFGLHGTASGASPDFTDLDGDGDLDAFVGEFWGGRTVFFENTGTASVPDFAAPDSEPFGLPSFGSWPDFADIDGDGDLDAFRGSTNGSTIFFENTGTPSAPSFGPPVTNPFGLAAVAGGSSSFAACPEFVDIDGDGDIDAFVGWAYVGLIPVSRSTGPLGEFDKIVYFENTGTPSAPAFGPPVPDAFGLELDTVENLAFSPAFADLDGDGDLDAFVVGWDGWVRYFENVPPCAPEASCTAGFARASLTVNERKFGKEKLTAKLAKGPALAQSDFGDPTVADGTVVAVCLSDDAGTLVQALEIDRAGTSCGRRPCWRRSGDDKGFAYKDSAGGADGVRKIKLKGGNAGKSSLTLSASNNLEKGQTALPTGIAAALADATSVRVQVHTSDGACFGETLSEITKQKSDQLEAR